MSVNFAQYALNAPSDKLAGIVQIFMASSFALRELRFEETSEFSKEYNQQATLGGIAFRGINEQYTPDTGVINPKVEVLRIMGGSVKTDRQLAKGPRGSDLRANNIAAKVKKAGYKLDATIINGDSSINPLEFDGLKKRLTGKQVIEIATNGGQLTLAKLDAAIDAVAGSNAGKVILCNLPTRTKIKQLVLASAGGAAMADFVNGEIDRYNGCRIEVIDEDDRELPVMPFNETQGSSNVTASLYVVRPGQTDGEYLRGLVRQPDGAQPIDYVDYGERNGVYEELVEAVMGIALYHPRCASRLKGILAPT